LDITAHTAAGSGTERAAKRQRQGEAGGGA